MDFLIWLYLIQVFILYNFSFQMNLKPKKSGLLNYIKSYLKVVILSFNFCSSCAAFFPTWVPVLGYITSTQQILTWIEWFSICLQILLGTLMCLNIISVIRKNRMTLEAAVILLWQIIQVWKKGHLYTVGLLEIFYIKFPFLETLIVT